MAGQAAVPPRVHKRSISDQQRRREIALERQKQSRRDLQQHARQLASGFSPPSSPSQWDDAAHNDDCSRSLDQQDSMLFQVSSFGPLAFLLLLLLCVGICFVFGLVTFTSVCLLMTVPAIWQSDRMIDRAVLLLFQGPSVPEVEEAGKIDEGDDTQVSVS
jgi:hypothetical protein